LDDILHTIRISTDAISPKDRVEVAREVFGRQILRLELEEADGVPYTANLKLQSMPGLAIVTGPFSAARISRTRALLSDGNDDIFLTANQMGAFGVEQRGSEFVLGEHESVFSSCNDKIVFNSPAGASMGLRIPRAALAGRVSNLDDRLNKLIPPGDEIMTLLRSYMHIFEAHDDLPVAFIRLATTHIHDLLALSLGARPDFSEVARERGLSVARLRAIKATILRHLARHDLSVSVVATLSRLTTRHVQRLFENEGTTFSRFVLERRLAHIHAQLTDPGQAHKNISTIVFESGLGDASYFNHAFRKRYGATPTDVRHQSLRSASQIL
jgi:AraC-like DNA-binding protein